MDLTLRALFTRVLSFVACIPAARLLMGFRSSRHVFPCGRWTGNVDTWYNPSKYPSDKPFDEIEGVGGGDVYKLIEIAYHGKDPEFSARCARAALEWTNEVSKRVKRGYCTDPHRCEWPMPPHPAS
jgi:hypothetical protein